MLQELLKKSRSEGEELAEVIKEAARSVELNLLPEKSSKVYQYGCRKLREGQIYTEQIE